MCAKRDMFSNKDRSFVFNVLLLVWKLIRFCVNLFYSVIFTNVVIIIQLVSKQKVLCQKNLGNVEENPGHSFKWIAK